MKKMMQLQALAKGVWFKLPDAPIYGRLEGNVMVFDDGQRVSMSTPGVSIEFAELFKVVQVREEETAEASL